jgi:hypothetical protein
MPTISLGWVETAANNAGAGDVAWSSVDNIKIQNYGVESWATAELDSGESTQWLQFTNWGLDLAVASGAIVTGVLVEVHGYTRDTQTTVKNFVEKQFFLVNAGSTIGTDQATGRPLGGPGPGPGGDPPGDPKSDILRYGGPSDTCGASLTPAICNGSTFGGQFRAENPTSAGITSDEARINTVQMAVYWNAAPACRLVPVTPSTVKAGNIIGVHARDSIVGTSNPEHVIIRFYVINYPTGYVPRTFNSPVPGLEATVSQNGDGRGWCYLIQAKLPGTYTIIAQMLLKDNGVWKKVTSNPVSFTVEADNRTKFYLDPDEGDDDNCGGEEDKAWKTLGKVHTELSGKRDWTLAIKDDTVLEYSGPTLLFTDVKNAHIVRYGGGTNKPIIRGMAGTHIWNWHRATDLMFVGIRIEYDATVKWAFGEPAGIHRLGLVDVDCHNVGSVIEGNQIMVVLIENLEATDFERYVLGVFGDVAYSGQQFDGERGMVCVWGGLFRVKQGVSAEGTFRFNNVVTTREWGSCVSINFAKFDLAGTPYATVRHGWSYTFLNRCYFKDGTMGAAHPPDGSPSNGPADWVCTIHGCVFDIDAAIQFISSGVVWFARQGHHACLSHCVCLLSSGGSTKCTSILGGRAGQCYHYSWANCMLVVPEGTGEARLCAQNTNLVDAVGLLVVGCCEVYATGLSTALYSKFIANASATQWFSPSNQFLCNLLAKDGGQTDAGSTATDTADLNSKDWAEGNAVVAIESGDCDEDDGWVTSGMAIVPSAALLVAEDARGIAHNPATDALWNAGPVNGNDSDAGALMGYVDATPTNTSYSVAWGFVTRDPGSGAAAPPLPQC